MPQDPDKDKDKAASKLEDEQTPDCSDSDEDAASIDRATAYMAQLEAIRFSRAERELREARTRFWTTGTELLKAMIEVLKGRWGGFIVLAFTVTVCAICLQMAGIDPEMGRLYEVGGRLFGNETAPVVQPAPVPAPPAPLLPVQPDPGLVAPAPAPN